MPELYGIIFKLKYLVVGEGTIVLPAPHYDFLHLQTSRSKDQAQETRQKAQESSRYGLVADSHLVGTLDN
ncbi:MAG: hypothetical protein HC780_04355 [Leptolyngbyaceae cyanobacterium CSU_1_3]|nr:hypothetical protein [Leptolyngbyaceae cyanobacterium CSU_1_3]